MNLNGHEVMQGWTLIQLTKVVRECIEGKFLLYKFIEDCTYSMRPHIYNPFKGYPKSLEGYKANWNFIQSCIHIYIRHVLGISKEIWRCF